MPPAPPLPQFVDAYIGYAPMPDLSTNDEIWIRRGSLQIHGDQIKLSTSALVCSKGKVFSSESDGGFYSYEGTISGAAETRIAILHLVDCDYCMHSASDETRVLKFHAIDANTIELDGIRMDRWNPPFPDTCPTVPTSNTLPPEGSANDTDDRSR
jgi:hypothetical protein